MVDRLDEDCPPCPTPQPPPDRTGLPNQKAPPAMTISAYDASVPVFVRGFRVLTELLDKAEAQADGARLIEARLAPDMLTLAGQVQRASDTAKFAIARIGDVQPPSFEDNETTFADLRKRIDSTVAWLESVDCAVIEAGETRPVSRKFKETEHTCTAAS